MLAAVAAGALCELIARVKAWLAGGLQGFDLLENGVKPLLQLALGAGLALCPAKAGVVFDGLSVKSGGLHQEFAFLGILGGHVSILIQLWPFLRQFLGIG